MSGNTCYLCLNDSMVCVGNSIKNIQLVHRIATAGNNFSSVYVNHMICQLNIEGNMYLEKCYDFDISAFPWNPFGDPSFTSVFILNRVTLKQGSILWVHILSPTSDFHTPGMHFTISPLGILSPQSQSQGPSFSTKPREILLKVCNVPAYFQIPK